jgi:hypothetical protein
MPSEFPAPVIGALVSSAFAVATALYSLSVAQRSRKMETTRDVLRKYFSAEFTLIRRESATALLDFWGMHKRGQDIQCSALLHYLISYPLDEYRFEQDRSPNNLSTQQNTLLFLYFWAEVEAYRKRNLLDLDLVREVLISQWDLYRDVLIQLVCEYDNAVRRDSEKRKLSDPPWALAIKAAEKWMTSPSR